MSLIKNIEIDTLKLRNLQVRDNQNNPISTGFHIYANGDGTTYWSTGVNAQEFINLSTNVDNVNSTLVKFQSSATSTIRNITSSLAAEVFSSIYSLSSFIQNLQTYSINTAYTDAALAQYSTGVEQKLTTTYQTIDSSELLYNLAIDNTAQVASQIYNDINTTNNTIVSTNAIIAKNSTITTSTLFGNLSTYTTSTFSGIFVIESTNFGVLSALILANVAFTENSLEEISTSQGKVVSSITNVPFQLASTIGVTSTMVSQGMSTTYVSSMIYTNSAISTLYISTTKAISTLHSTVSSELISSISSLIVSRNISISTILSSVYAVSTSNGSTLAYFQENINVLLSTGLTQNIYQTFIDLQAYSANIISGTTSTSNYVINSTNTSLEQQNISSYNGLLNSSFNYFSENIYASTMSTVIPQMISTMNVNISTTNSSFTAIMISTTQYFELLVNATYVAFTEDVTSYLLTSEQQISTQVANGLSTQNSILSTAIILNNQLLDEALSSNVFSLSSFTYSQYTTAPSIIMNKVSNLSTLENVGTVTGLSSLIAGIVKLDTTKYNNFYILVSDIGANIYYGLTLSTSREKINQDFTVQIDIQSTYKNNFFTLDTSNLSNWLSTPKIYNPNSFNLITNEFVSNNVPKPDTVQQIYLSTFIGAYVIDMKYTPMGMFIKNIQTYPFIYTNATFTGSIVIPKNVQTANIQLGLHSSFVYRGTPIKMSWQTNDLNIPLGIKFTGTDLYGRQITSWAGPYSSALGTANVKIPTPNAPFAKYDMMYLGVYPNNPRLDNTASGNTSGLIFNSRTIPSSLYVVNPTINSYIRVLNPGTVNNYLQVAEIKINNDIGKNMTQERTNCVFTEDTDVININTFPYNGSYVTFGWQNAFDNNVSTYFYGGYTASQINPNAYVGGYFSTISSFAQLPQSSLLISSIDIYQGPLYSLQDMQLILSNRNEPGLSDDMFYSTIVLVSTNSQSFSFN
jgi:hypothetical protein